MNVALTVTYNRPQIQFLCWCLNQQVLKPDLWLIVYNGNVSPQQWLSTQIHYKIVNNTDINEHPIVSNLYKSLEYFKEDDNIVIFDDDDYYGPFYFKDRIEDLQYHPLVGQKTRYYINLTDKTYKIFSKSSFGNGQSLAFKGSCKKNLQAALNSCRQRKNSYWDKYLSWSSNVKEAYIYDYAQPMISLVGWGIGTKGTCSQHRKTFELKLDQETLFKYLPLQALEQISKISPKL